MKLILMRHGEATDNVNELISDKEIYWSILTEKGIKTVEESVESLPDDIDIAYVSPLPRTIETANFVYKKYSNIEFIIDNRIKEIQYGKYSHCKNNEELDNVRMKQINGDYFTRFGDTGENKYDIEKRLSEFLNDIYNQNKDKTVLVVTHGSISSYMKRILEQESTHIQTGKIEILDIKDNNKIINRLEELDKINNEN